MCFSSLFMFFYIKFSTKLIYSYLPQISHRFLPYLKCKSTQCQFFFQEGGGMRVGSDYQAKVPEYKPGLCLQKKSISFDYVWIILRFVTFGILYYDIEIKPDPRNDAILVWAPAIDLSDGKGKNHLNKNKVVKLILHNHKARCLFALILFSVDEYVNIAKEKHGYNTEQVPYCCFIVLLKENFKSIEELKRLSLLFSFLRH